MISCARLPPYPPALSTVIDESGERGQIVALALSATRQVSSLRALSRSTIEQGKSRSKVRHALVFEQPGKIHIETLPPVAAYALALLAGNEGKACYLDTTEKIAACADAASHLLQHSIGIALPAEDTLSLLAGRIPAKAFADLQSSSLVQLSRNHGEHDVLIRYGSKAYLWELDGGTGVLKRARIGDAFKPRTFLDIAYADFQVVDGILLPRSVDLTVAREDLHIALRFTSLSCNGDYPDSLFEVKIPADYRVRKIGVID